MEMRPVVHSMTADLLRKHATLVMKALGCGHTETVYHRAMITSLNSKGIQHRSEVACPVMFMGEIVGSGRADLVVGDLVVELKANRKCPSEASAQLNKYVENLSEIERRPYRGMVINFGQATQRVETIEEKTKALKSRFFHDVEEIQTGKRRRL